MKFKILALSFLVSIAGMAQHQHEQPFIEDDIMVHEEFKKRFPHLANKVDAEEAKLEAFTQDFVQHQSNGSRADVDYIIPVVFHILHQNGAENVTDTEIHDAMRILNEDFQKTNDDVSQVVSQFQSIVGDAKIEFRLARKDPNGNPTTGIDRIQTPLTDNAGENSKLNPWPRSTYLNVWIVRTIGSGAAGYTFLPSSAHFMPNQDGIILLYTYFASTRTGNQRRSRALTHEIGHWLNLPHLWGRTNSPGRTSNCSDDDGVFDTPNTIGWTSCSINGTSCGSLDNVQNFMEYSYCSNMFTKGQVQRMHAALSAGTAERNKLVSKANNLKAGVLDLELAEFSVSKNVACVNEPVQFFDQSIYDAVSWKWEFEGGTPATSTQENPVVSYAKPGVFKVKLTATAANGNIKVKDTESFMTINKSVGDFLPYTEGFEDHVESSVHHWVAQNEDNDKVYWKIASGVGYEGSKYLMLENSKNIQNQVEAVVSEPIDLSNIDNPKISFYVAHAKGTTLNPGASVFRVYYSSDCGETWVIKYGSSSDNLSNGKSAAGSFYPKQKSDWKRFEINSFTTADKVQNGLLKFEFENIADNNIFIDNINITGAYSQTPVLEFPTNKLDSVASTVYLDWKAIPIIDKYEYEVSELSDFSTTLFKGSKQYLGTNPNNDDTRFLATGLTAGKTYYWRVRAVRGALTSNWSEEWSFTVSSTGKGVEFIDGRTVSVEPLAHYSESKSSVFPNPVTSSLFVELGSETASGLDILDLQGRVIWSQKQVESGKIDFDFTSLNKGIYLVKIVQSNRLETHKIIVR